MHILAEVEIISAAPNVSNDSTDSTGDRLVVNHGWEISFPFCWKQSKKGGFNHPRWVQEFTKSETTSHQPFEFPKNDIRQGW